MRLKREMSTKRTTHIIVKMFETGRGELHIFTYCKNYFSNIDYVGIPKSLLILFVRTGTSFIDF